MGEEFIQFLKSLVKSGKLDPAVLDLKGGIGSKPLLEQVEKIAPEETAKFKSDLARGKKQANLEQTFKPSPEQLAVEKSSGLNIPEIKSASESAKAFEDKSNLPIKLDNEIPDVEVEGDKSNLPALKSPSELAPIDNTPTLENKPIDIDKSKAIDAELSPSSPPTPDSLNKKVALGAASGAAGLTGALGEMSSSDEKTNALIGDMGDNKSSLPPTDKFQDWLKNYKEPEKSLAPAAPSPVAPRSSSMKTMTSSEALAPKDQAMLAAIAASQPNKSSDEMEALRGVQRNAAMAEFVNRLGMAGNTFLSGVNQGYGGKALGNEGYESGIKSAQGLTEQYIKNQEFKRETEMRDPNSAVSLAHQAFAKELKLPKEIYEGKSAADLKALEPYITKIQAAREHANVVKLRQQELNQQKEQALQYKQDQDSVKMANTINNQISTLKNSGRGNIGKAQAVYNNADKMPAIVEQFKDPKTGQFDPNLVTPVRVHELEQTYQQILSAGGQGSDALRKAISSPNLKLSVMELAQKIKSDPVGAQQSGFVQQFLEGAKKLKEVADAQVREGIIEHLAAPSKHMNEADVQTIKTIHGITPEDEKDYKPGSLVKKVLSATSGTSAYKPKTVIQDGHTYTLNEKTGEYD